MQTSRRKRTSGSTCTGLSSLMIHIYHLHVSGRLRRLSSSSLLTYLGYESEGSDDFVQWQEYQRRAVRNKLKMRLEKLYSASLLREDLEREILEDLDDVNAEVLQEYQQSRRSAPHALESSQHEQSENETSPSHTPFSNISRSATQGNRLDAMYHVPPPPFDYTSVPSHMSHSRMSNWNQCVEAIPVPAMIYCLSGSRSQVDLQDHQRLRASRTSRYCFRVTRKAFRHTSPIVSAECHFQQVSRK